MILAAALLVLVALGLFVGGVVTGNTTLYWACVGVSAGAAVLLILARRQLGRPGTSGPPAARANRETTAPKSMTQTTTTKTIPPEAVQPPTAPASQTPADTGEPSRPADGTATHAEAEQRQALRGHQAAGGAHAAPAAESGRGAHAAEPAHAAPVSESARGAHAAEPARAAGPEEAGEPPVEEVEVTDLLLVVDLKDEVLVVDEHPRYHLAGCPRLTAEETFPLPVDEARRDGFTPCAVCAPDRHLADLERARRAARRAP